MIRIGCMPEAEQHADDEDERYAPLPVHEPFKPNIDFRHALLVLLLIWTVYRTVGTESYFRCVRPTCHRS
jgi:hypothetical protein